MYMYIRPGSAGISRHTRIARGARLDRDMQQVTRTGNPNKYRRDNIGSVTVAALVTIKCKSSEVRHGTN
jgi:hypothetical protein